MVIIGVDSHKRTHTVVAVDETGRKLGEKTALATPDGHLELRAWASRLLERAWALEDCRHLSRRLESDLLRAGERVLRVPPKLMAGARRSGREPGKSDPIDALAVARAALREPDLPVAVLDGPERDLRLLVDHRDDLVAERTRDQARLRWHLHELDPGNEPPARSLDRAKVLAALDSRLGAFDGTVARLARALVARIRALTTEIDALEGEIAGLVRSMAPSLLALRGCGPLSAAKLVGEAGGIGRFRSRAAFARREAATASSTPLSTGSPSPRSASGPRVTATWSSASPRATRRPRHTAPCAAGSATRSTAGCATMTASGRPGEHRSPRPLDIGATGGR
jgi:transposase